MESLNLAETHHSVICNWGPKEIQHSSS